MDFITPLLSWFAERWDEIKFIVFVRDYEEVVIYRGGKSKKVLKAGVGFKFSFIDDMVTIYVAEDTIKTPSQMLYTKDGVNITISCVVQCHVEDSLLYANKVNDPKQAISDFAEVWLSRNVVNTNFEDCNNERLMKDVEIDLRRVCKKYGVYIDTVTINTLTQSRSFNIFKEAESHL